MTRTERFRAARQDRGLVVLEGFHVLKHAARFDAVIVEVAVRQGTPVAELLEELAPDLATLLERAPVLGAREFDTLSPHPPATGVIGLAERPSTDVLKAATRAGTAPLVLLEEPTRLGNIGAAVRVAAAAGAEGLITTGPHDPWSPESVRGAAGLQFAVPVARVDSLPPSSRPLVALVADGAPLDRSRLPSAPILAFGNERHGLSPALRRRAALELSIPMRPGVSSLNLATSVAVALYWWTLAGPPGALQRR